MPIIVEEANNFPKFAVFIISLQQNILSGYLFSHYFPLSLYKEATVLDVVHYLLVWSLLQCCHLPSNDHTKSLH